MKKKHKTRGISLHPGLISLIDQMFEIQSFVQQFHDWYAN